MSEDQLFEVQCKYWLKADDRPNGGYVTANSLYIVAPNIEKAIASAGAHFGDDMLEVLSAVQLSNENQPFIVYQDPLIA